MKTELHVHTRFSHDSLLGLNLLAVMCKIKKINCVVICDHNTISGVYKARKVLSNYGIGVIAGEEIFTDSGEIIGLFLKKNIPPGLTAIETVYSIKSQGGLVYIPHPYDCKRYKTVLKVEALKEIADQIDFIEVHNGRNISLDFSIRQKEIADQYTDSEKTVRICGSDAHTFFEIGRNYLISEGYQIDNPKDFKEKLKKAQPHIAVCLPFSHVATKVIRLINWILEGNIDELHRIIKRRCSKRS